MSTLQDLAQLAHFVRSSHNSIPSMNNNKMMKMDHDGGMIVAPAVQAAAAATTLDPATTTTSSSSASSGAIPGQEAISKSKEASQANQRSSSTYQFPWKLHQLLTDAQQNNDEYIVSWLPNGRAFQIHNKELFIEKYMPQYFNTQTYKSFHRSLNLWGFQSLKRGNGPMSSNNSNTASNTPHMMMIQRMMATGGGSGSGNGGRRSSSSSSNKNQATTVGAYFHHLFLRGQPHLCHQMKRIKNKLNDPILPSAPNATTTTTSSTGTSFTTMPYSFSSRTSTSGGSGGSSSGSGGSGSIDSERCKAAIAAAVSADEVAAGGGTSKGSSLSNARPDMQPSIPSSSSSMLATKKMMMSKLGGHANSTSSIMQSLQQRTSRMDAALPTAFRLSPHEFILHGGIGIGGGGLPHDPLQQHQYLNRDDIISQALRHKCLPSSSSSSSDHHAAAAFEAAVAAAAAVGGSPSSSSSTSMLEAVIARRRRMQILQEQKLLLLQQQEEDMMIDAIIRQRQHEAKMKGLQIEIALNVLSSSSSSSSASPSSSLLPSSSA